MRIIGANRTNLSAESNTNWPTDSRQQTSPFNLLRYSVLITPAPLHHSSTPVSHGAGHSHSDTTFFNHHSSYDTYLGSRPLASQQQVRGQFREASFRRFPFSFDCTAFGDIDGKDLEFPVWLGHLSLFHPVFAHHISNAVPAHNTQLARLLDLTPSTPLPSQAIPTS